MADRLFRVLIVAVVLTLACSRQEPPAEQSAQKPAPLVILKPKPNAMSPEQRTELGFPEELIKEVEAAADAGAEPFYEDVLIRTANLRGDVMMAAGKLAGFSVRTARADDVIGQLSPSFRKQGFLIFRSEQNYGKVPDIVTVARGNNSYDILQIQKTGSANYHLETKAIVAWLRKQQQLGTFVVTGAGADWMEARFVQPPRNMKAFARRIALFAPDVLAEYNGSIDRLTDGMRKANGFHLWWD